MISRQCRAVLATRREIYVDARFLAFRLCRNLYPPPYVLSEAVQCGALTAAGRRDDFRLSGFQEYKYNKVETERNSQRQFT